MSSYGDGRDGVAEAPVDVCKAIPIDGTAADNILFVPPCDCPRCAPDRYYDRSADGREWLRIAGRDQRYRVEVVELGLIGREVLG